MATSDAQLQVVLPSGLDTDANPLDTGGSSTAVTFQNFIPGLKNQLTVRGGFNTAGVLKATPTATVSTVYPYAIGCLQYGTKTVSTYQFASGDTSISGPFIPLPMLGDARASKLMDNTVPGGAATSSSGKIETRVMGYPYRELQSYYTTTSILPSTSVDSVKLLAPIYRNIEGDLTAATSSTNADYTVTWDPGYWTSFGNSIMMAGLAMALPAVRNGGKSKGNWSWGFAATTTSQPLLWGGSPPPSVSSGSLNSALRGVYTASPSTSAGATTVTIYQPTASFELPVVGDLVTLSKDGYDNYWNGVYRVTSVSTTSVSGANTYVTLTVQTPIGSVSQGVASGAIQLSAWTQGSASNEVRVWRILTLPNAPTDMGCLAVYQNRLFGGRGVVCTSSGTAVGQYFGYYNNVLQWSAVGNPLYWPDSNFVLLDESLDDPITALAATDDFMLIFRRSSIYILTGYDESTFNINQLSSTNGCFDPRAVYSSEGTVYWANRTGVYRFRNNGIESLTGNGSSGIGALVTQALGRGDGSDGVSLARITSLRVTNNGKLVLSSSGTAYESLGSSSPPSADTLAASWQGINNASFVLDLATGTWATFKHAATNSAPTLYVGLFGRTLGLTRFGLIGIDAAFAPDLVSVSATNTTRYGDQSPTGAISGGINPQYVMSSVPPQAVCTLDVPVMGSKTMRLREIEIQGNTQRYDGYSASAQNDWSVDVATDPNITTFTNWGGFPSTRRSSGTTVQRHYVKTSVLRYAPTSGAAAEGRRFVVRLRYTGIASGQADGLYLSTFAVTLRAEPTRDSRVPTE